MRVIFFGTPQIAANILESLVAGGVEVVAVVTRPDKPKGRSGKPQPPPVKVMAQKVLPGIPIFQPQKISTEEYVELLEFYNADLFVVAAYGEILRQPILDIPTKGCINVHASLLPKYRGAAPIQHCLLNGEKVTGVTIMKMVLKMDAGDMLSTVEVPISDDMTAGELTEELQKAGSKALLEVIKKYEKGPVKGVVQDHDAVTFAPKLTHDEGQVHFTGPATQAHNVIRAFSPHPGAWCFIHVNKHKKRLKILRSSLIEGSGKPGHVIEVTDQGIVVACKEGALLIRELQPEGKRVMPASEFARGVVHHQLSFES